MPVAPRSNKKAQDIVYNLIGIPPNMVEVRKNKQRKRRDRRLEYKESRLQR